MKRQLDEIILQRKVKTVFQPIISLIDGDVLGHEALSTVTLDCDIKNIGYLFELSERYNRVWDLELLCRTLALETAFKKINPRYSKKLFLNVNPNIMNDEKFQEGFTRDCLKEYGITPKDIIFEITERTAVYDIDNFKKVIEHYKRQNYEIAIDDVGSGHSGLNLIANIKPHYIKLDMELIRDINQDYSKKAVVKSMVLLAQLLNIKLIAEGIETRSELKTLIELGVHYGQGYYIQKPDEQLLDIRLELVQEIYRYYHQSHSSLNHSHLVIGDLCVNGTMISFNMRSNEIADLFRKNEDLTGVCVVDKSIPKGIITKTNFFLYLGSRYGYSLNQNKTASSLMDDEFLTVDYHTTIQDVMKLAMARTTDQVYDFIVVTKGGEYQGIVTIKDLLENAMHSEVMNAKNQNPLTGLSGNLIVDQMIAKTIQSPELQSIMYIDIDHFKVYNDMYGFKNGDLIIKLLANILTKHEGEGVFIGHIGGDDFIMICDYYKSDNLAQRIMQDFDQKVRQYYHEEDLKRGYVTGKSREGEVKQFPIASISVAATVNQSPLYSVTEELAQIKKRCKAIKGSCFIQEVHHIDIENPKKTHLQ